MMGTRKSPRPSNAATAPPDLLQKVFSGDLLDHVMELLGPKGTATSCSVSKKWKQVADR